MAIAEMSRMKLLGVKSEEELVLSALHKTCAIQIISNTKIENEERQGEFVEKFDRLNFACNFLFSNVNRIAKEVKGQQPLKEEVYGVTYDEFINALSLEQTLSPVIDGIYEINKLILEHKAKILSLKQEVNCYLPFKEVKERLSAFADTKETKVFLGTIKAINCEGFLNSDLPCFASVESQDNGNAVLSVVCLNKDENTVVSALSQAGFSRTNLNGDFTAEEKIKELNSSIKREYAYLSQLDEQILGYKDNLKNMKILLDRYSFEIEKSNDKSGFQRTDETYLLEAFVPTEAVKRVEEAILNTSDKVYTEFSVVPRDQFAPTLMKNKKVTKQFEFITNLFSPCSYGSVDHSFVMMIFFSVFMGFIMADMGYGLLMIAGGFLLAKKIGRDTGTARLANIIAVGGVFTLLFGALFDSFFGYGLLRGIGLLDKPLMPDAISDKLSLAGISVPTLLLLSLGMGVVQIMASLLLKASWYFSRGRILDGILDGVVWALLMFGLILFVLELSGLVNRLMTPSVILMLSCVVIGVVGAGRHEKGFGKFTKSFGALYGLINYMSDILSYARLYGLMLSGAQIAIIVTNMSLPMFSQGAMAIVGAIIMVIGHGFNLAMGILGAYIHDSRLQYIEFFGRFYEGDGELFQPFGTKFENTYFQTAK